MGIPAHPFGYVPGTRVTDRRVFICTILCTYYVYTTSLCVYTVPFVVANLSDVVDDRLDSVDVDGGSGVLTVAGGLLCSTTSVESSSDSLSDDSMAASTCTQ